MRTTITHSIVFGENGNAEEALLYGWHLQEKSFAWSLGHESALQLPLIDAPFGFFIEMHVQPFIRSRGPVWRHMRVAVNGRCVGQTVLTREGVHAFYVPPLRWESRRIVVTISDSLESQILDPDSSPGIAFTRIRLLKLEEQYERKSLRAISPEYTERRYSEDELRLLAQSFVSLGSNCEFGFAQRQMGAEPLDMLRFAGIPIIRLLHGIDEKFAGLDVVDNLQPLDAHQWDIRDKKYHLTYHTFLTSEQIPWDEMVKREARRLRFLADKLIGDLEEGDKIFVWWSAAPCPEDEILPLYLAMRRHGPARLLWVETGDNNDFVEEAYPGLYRASIRSLTPPGNHNLPEMHKTWLPILEALRIHISPNGAMPIPEAEVGLHHGVIKNPDDTTKESIVFIGNCQAHSLSVAYNAFSDPGRAGSLARFVDWRSVSASDKDAIATADTIVLQVADLCEQIPDYVPRHAKLVLFPYISGGFLWPYATEPHLAFIGSDMGRVGAFGEMGDAFLNRMIRQGVSVDVAVEEYLALDPVRDFKCDRRFELFLDRQLRRDTIAGIDVATFIRETLGEVQLFRARGHLGRALARFVTAKVFEKLGLTALEIRRVFEPGFHEFYERNEHPLHPKIAEYFKLSYVKPGHRFRLNHGFATFEQYCAQYMKQTFNKEIYLGLEQLNRGLDLTTAVKLLSDGLEMCPDSLNGWLGLAEVHARLGDLNETAIALQRAALIDSADVRVWSAWADLHLKSGKYDLAGEDIARMLEIEPGHSHALHLSRVLEAQSGSAYQMSH